MNNLFSTARMSIRSKAGFGLVELLISIGIMMLVTTTVLVRQGSFNSSILLENQAYEVAFDIRQTQLQAVSAQSGVDDDFYSSYQITFTTGTRMYDVFRISAGGSETRLGAPRQLDARFTIAAIMGDGSSLGDSVSIQFRRPNFDALFLNETGSEIVADNIQIFVCPTANTAAETAERIGRMQSMANGTIPQNLRYDLNGDGAVDSADVSIAQTVDCAYRMVDVSNAGQISVK